ncbi:MAG: MoaD/ThiS family protein [Treponema sp.]|jgi:molybdopterin synthase sulfur carrier subunit|nr:MoaD/ThiS family protein [Treponema sp.]
MRVRFFANLRSLTGCAETDVPYRETAGALALSLCEKYGDKLRLKIFSPASGEGKEGEEKFNSEIIILVNGRHVSHLGGFHAPLQPDDRVDVFPMVAGG